MSRIHQHPAETVRKRDRLITRRDVACVTELERELKAIRTELHEAISNLEISREEQRSLNEDALSASEEFQSANDKLVASKEELQSLNDALTALNVQLREALDEQRMTSTDLQDVFQNTDIAALFLDSDLNIGFFTAATESIIGITPTDIGRPLADVQLLAGQDDLLIDARTVLQNIVPFEREIETHGGAWYVRRISPRRTHEGAVDGVVITFADITEGKHAADALEAARWEAQLESIAKSRFFAAASHDLRQPLQTLALLHGLLAKGVEGERAENLVARLDETLGGMSAMLNTMLDINQIDAAVVRAEMVNFPVDDVLGQLREEFTSQAAARGLDFRVVSGGGWIHSDPRLLVQMIRNLLSNALKYTKRGKILLGCRQREGTVSIQIWDTGFGMPGGELKTVFGEENQADDPTFERSRGLGLSIVRRLGLILGHPVHVRSRTGKGSVFSIEVVRSPSGTPLPTDNSTDVSGEKMGGAGITAHPRAPRTPNPVLRPEAPVIFVVDDDTDVRDAIRSVFEEVGKSVEDFASGEAFIEAYHAGREACLLVDAYMPGMSGIELLERLNDAGHRLPAIMITAYSDVPMVVRAMKAGASDFIEKPVRREELVASVERALELSRNSNRGAEIRADAARQVASLTPRQRQIMDLVLAGRASKNIAADLGISQRTVENHRAAIMEKTGCRSLPALARLAVDAAASGSDAARGQSDSAATTASTGQ